MAHPIKMIAELVGEQPDLRKVMKRFRPDRFVCCGVEIASHPPDFPGLRVYGDFLVDRAAVARGGAGQVKQDFLILETATGRVSYYSGRASPDEPRLGKHIKEFARRFRGTAHYGVHADGSLLVGNHRYADDADSSLAVEDAIRRRIGDCLRLARRDAHAGSAAAGG